MDLGPEDVLGEFYSSTNQLCNTVAPQFPLGLDPRPPQISKTHRCSSVLYTMAWYLHKICTILLYTLNHLQVTYNT